MLSFIVAGIVYLIGVALVLFLKPSLMFTPDGQWKEFGIGQNPDRYSPFPFWLFCLVWAIVSYLLVILFTSVKKPSVSLPSFKSNTNNSVKKININQAELDIDYARNGEVDLEDTVELPKGYYVLNKKATKLAGVPKYVYIGEEN